ncbi:MAG: BrnA antitoxin family protein [Aquisalimonadaceae bacterium]
MTNRSKLIDDDGEVRELTKEDFKRMRPASDVLPELLGKKAAEEALKPKRGRPKKKNPKELVSLRLSPEVIKHFRAKGRGWQTKLDEALKKYVERENSR